MNPNTRKTIQLLLLSETIERALFEDFHFNEVSDVKDAIDYLISKLQHIDPLDFVAKDKVESV